MLKKQHCKAMYIAPLENSFLGKNLKSNMEFNSKSLLGRTGEFSSQVILDH